MKFKKFMAAFKAAGFTGANTAADVKKWLAENPQVEFVDSDTNKSIDIDALFAVKKVVVAFDAGEQVEVIDAAAKSDPAMAEEEEEVPAPKSAKRPNLVLKVNAQAETKGGGWTGKSQANYMARKHYDIAAGRGLKAHSCADEAEAFGAWCRKSVARLHPRLSDYGNATADAEIVKTLTTGGATTGEALVPTELMPSLIVNIEKYGVARKVCPPVSLSQGATEWPNLVADFAAGGMAEGVAETAQDTPTTNRIVLIAKKIGGIVQVSNELFNDSVLSISDLLTEAFARGLAKREDNNYFNGDGTSAYDGIVGVCPRIKGLSGTIANIAGLTVASGNLFSEVVLNDFWSVIGSLPQYADNDGRTKWVMHKTAAWATAHRLQYAGGGNNVQTIGGGTGPSFGGYGVEYAQIMPRVDANSQVFALFGDFTMGSKFGIVNNSMAIASSEHVAFTADAVTFRVVERIAINVHDVGNASATAASRVPGPIVGLISAAS